MCAHAGRNKLARKRSRENLGRSLKQNNFSFAAMKDFNPIRYEIYGDFLQYYGRIYLGLFVGKLGSLVLTNFGMS